MVVDISDPSDPDLVAGPLDPRRASRRASCACGSRRMLIVLNTNCGVGDQLHHCTQPSISNIKFYDVSGRNAKRPKLIRQFGVDTHEFFLWEDPENADRALIFAGNAGSTCMPRGGAPSCPLSVWDISQVADGGEPVTLYSGDHAEPVQKPAGGLHSLTVSNDGSRAYFALLTGGFAVVDTSAFAEGEPMPQAKPITVNEQRRVWSGPGAHSAVKLWARDTAWVSDEVYGTATGTGHGCPWGWTRMIDISDPTAPEVKGEYREPENRPDTCDLEPAADLLLRPQPDADAAYRVQHLAATRTRATRSASSPSAASRAAAAEHHPSHGRRRASGGARRPRRRQRVRLALSGKTRSATPVSANTRCTAGGPGTTSSATRSRSAALRASTIARIPEESTNVTPDRSSTTFRNPASHIASKAAVTSSLVARSISPSGLTRTASRSGTTSQRNGCQSRFLTAATDM